MSNTPEPKNWVDRDRYLVRVYVSREDGSRDFYSWSVYGQRDMSYAVEELDALYHDTSFSRATITAISRETRDGIAQGIIVYERRKNGVKA